MCHCIADLLGHDLEGLSNLLFPRHLVLAEDLSRDWQLLATVEQNGAKHNRVRTHGLLVVVDVGGALRAVVAVDSLACRANIMLGSCLRLRGGL